MLTHNIFELSTVPWSVTDRPLAWSVLFWQTAEYNWIRFTANNWCFIPFNAIIRDKIAIIKLQAQWVMMNLKLKKTQLDITVKSAFQLIDKTANLILSKIAILIFSQFCWVFWRWNLYVGIKAEFGGQVSLCFSESETYPEPGLQIQRFGPRIPWSY